MQSTEDALLIIKQGLDVYWGSIVSANDATKV